MDSSSSPIPADYSAGCLALESGQYRQAIYHLEAALAHLEPHSALGGEAQMLLVTAYQGAGLLPEAIALCSQLARHPQLAVRQKSKRVLYILQAPDLNRKAEWLTQIPDLQDLDANDKKERLGGRRTASKPPVRKLPSPPPIDPREINTQDNGFLAVLLVVSALALCSLVGLALGSGGA